MSPDSPTGAGAGDAPSLSS